MFAWVVYHPGHQMGHLIKQDAPCNKLNRLRLKVAKYSFADLPKCFVCQQQRSSSGKGCRFRGWFYVYYYKLTRATLLSDCRVIDPSNGLVSFTYEAEPRPVFPQHFSRPITPNDIERKLVCLWSLTQRTWSDAWLESLRGYFTSCSRAGACPPVPTKCVVLPYGAKNPCYLW